MAVGLRRVQSQATHVLMAFFDAGLELELVEAERCTVLFGMPTTLIAMLEHPDFEGLDLSSVRLLLTAALRYPAFPYTASKRAP